MPTHKLFPLILIFIIFIFSSSFAQKYDISRQYSQEELQRDFKFLQNSLEEAHPGLYWYNTKDSMDYYFQQTYQKIDRPMTEMEFVKLLKPLIAQVRCGHTGIGFSKNHRVFRKKNKASILPIQAINVGSELFVLVNQSQDSTIKQGMKIISINEEPSENLIATLKDYVSSDGYNQTMKKWFLNARFQDFFYVMNGEEEEYRLELADSSGTKKSFMVKTLKKQVKKIEGKKDTTTKKASEEVVEGKFLYKPKIPTLPNLSLSLEDDATAILTLKTFSFDNQHKHYSKVFKELRKNKIENLIIDLRGNLGGSVKNCVQLLRYVVDSSFVFLKESEANTLKPSFNKYLNKKFTRWTRRLFEKKNEQGKYYSTGTKKPSAPIEKNHFNGKVFILINGGSASAGAIFPSIAKAAQPDKFTVIGRETGGGRYGCSALVMCNATLPITKCLLRIPLYKIVTDDSKPNEGRGLFPDYEIQYTRFAEILSQKDLDLEKVYELLKK